MAKDNEIIKQIKMWSSMDTSHEIIASDYNLSIEEVNDIVNGKTTSLSKEVKPIEEKNEVITSVAKKQTHTSPAIKGVEDVLDNADRLIDELIEENNIISSERIDEIKDSKEQQVYRAIAYASLKMHIFSLRQGKFEAIKFGLENLLPSVFGGKYEQKEKVTTEREKLTNLTEKTKDDIYEELMEESDID